MMLKGLKQLRATAMSIDLSREIEYRLSYRARVHALIFLNCISYSMYTLLANMQLTFILSVYIGEYS